MSCQIVEFDPVEATKDLQGMYHRTGKCGVAPGRLAPELVILHDVDEARAVMGDDDSEGTLAGQLAASGAVLGMWDMLHGFNYMMKHPGGTEEERRAWRPSAATEIVVVSAPKFNALEIKYATLPGRVIDEGYVSDHKFVRREPQPGDGGDDVIRQALARCQGCYDKGYHRPETKITCDAFGIPVPEHPGERPDLDAQTRRWLDGESREEVWGASRQDDA